jgi:hypothetical protein
MALSPATAAASATIVAILSAVISLAAYRVLLRNGNRTLWYVIVAFGIIALKNLAKAGVLIGLGAEDTWMELAFSLADLAAVALIAAPIVKRGA